MKKKNGTMEDFKYIIIGSEPKNCALWVEVDWTFLSTSNEIMSKWTKRGEKPSHCRVSCSYCLPSKILNQYKQYLSGMFPASRYNYTNLENMTVKIGVRVRGFQTFKALYESFLDAWKFWNYKGESVPRPRPNIYEYTTSTTTTKQSTHCCPEARRVLTSLWSSF